MALKANKLQLDYGLQCLSCLFILDFDVCSIPGMCSHICNNTNGGYFCSCPLGYRLVNGHNCTGKN